VLKSRVTSWVGIGDVRDQTIAYENSFEKINGRKNSTDKRRWQNNIKVYEKEEGVRR
jgi:hypothetical protein